MNELIGVEVMIYLLGVVSGIILSMGLVTLVHITTKRNERKFAEIEWKAFNQLLLSKVRDGCKLTEAEKEMTKQDFLASKGVK